MAFKKVKDGGSNMAPKISKIVYNSSIILSRNTKKQKFLNKRFSKASHVTKISNGHVFITTKEKKLNVMRYSTAIDFMVTIQY